MGTLPALLAAYDRDTVPRVSGADDGANAPP
jgi:hypothetical protein